MGEFCRDRQSRQYVWDGEPEGVYIPSGAESEMRCTSETAEVFIAGAGDEKLKPFAVRGNEIDLVHMAQTTPKHRISIFLARNRRRKSASARLRTVHRRCGRCQFPAAQARRLERQPDESRHDEVYNFRFKPDHGFGMQLLEPPEGGIIEAFHIVDGSTFAIEGYHPCVVAPGYEMYYFTILGGLSQRPLVQYFTLIMPGRSKRSRASRYDREVQIDACCQPERCSDTGA